LYLLNGDTEDFFILLSFKIQLKQGKKSMENLSAKENVTPEPEYLTPEQLSAKLQVARKTIKKWTLARRIPGQLKCGGRWRYRRNEIEKALLRGKLLNS
jgi:predicted DNA-binding transcriptional regulator AlpA